MLAAAVLVGVDALKELPIAHLLRPVGFDTLPVWVYNLALESRFEQAALPALTIVAVALIPVAMLSRHLDRVLGGVAPAHAERRPRHPSGAHVGSKRTGRSTPVDARHRGGRGELLALVGPSGCGKSTLLRLVAGLIAADAGTVRIAADVVDDGRAARARAPPIGLVFQEHALFPHLTVADNVTFGLRGRAAVDRHRAVDHWLGIVGLAGHGARYPHELSGGERQRVALARRWRRRRG